ncbi:ankyrin repeat-containing domain protein [Trichoderma camerunense]
MPEGARSDAPVTPKLNEGDIEDTTSAINVAPDSFWLASIEEDASALLDLIRENVDRGRILLVGYGFGGIVIKKAIFLAKTKTNSEYNDIAFQVDRLVFFSTPHRDGEKKEWERVIKNRMQATDAKPASRLPEILFWLFRSSSQISQDFRKLAAKYYPITNFIEKSDESAAKPKTAKGELANGMDDVESGPEKELHNFTLHEIATLDHLETLRTLFGLKQTYINGLTSSQQDYGGIYDYKYLLHRAAVDNNLEAFEVLLRLSEDDSEADNEKMTPLHMAAASGSTNIISHLLGKYTIEHEPTNIETFNSLDKKDKTQRTPLIVAASRGHEQATKLLLQSGANISIQDDTGKTALHYGALKSLVAVETYISSDLASLGDKDECTALHIAASSGNSICLLMSRSEETTGIRMLLAASEAGNVNIVRYLLMEKHVPPSSEWNGRLPICQAAIGGHLEVVCAILLRHKELVKQTDEEKKTALHHACDCGMREAAKLLLLNHANVEAQDWDGATPLHTAARKGRVNMINLLLEFKADIHSRSRKEETPLHMAVAHPDAVEALLKAGADPNSVAWDRETPLHRAVRQECWQSAVCLHNHAADPHKLDSKKQSPLYYAIAKDHLATVEKFIKDHDASVNLSAIMSWAIKYAACTVFNYFMSLIHTTVNNFHEFKADLLHDAVMGKSIEILDSFLRRSGVDANLLRNGSTALHLVAQNGYVYHVQKLIEFKANVDARDGENRTPLHLAAQKNEYETVKVLLDAGSDINAQDNDLVTPIHLATKFRAYRALQELIKYKADMNIATLSQGWTPLHASSSWAVVWATEVLLDAGADPNLSTHDGWTPLHIAACMENPSMVELLLQHGGDPAMTTKKETNDTVLHLALKCSDCNVQMLQLLIEHGADIDLRSSEKLSTLMLAVNTLDVGKLNLLLRTEIESRADPKWQLDDVIPAYRRAIALYKEDSKCLDIVKALLEKEPKLQGTESATELDIRILNDLRMQPFKGGGEQN